MKKKITAGIVTYNHRSGEILKIIEFFLEFKNQCTVYISDNSDSKEELESLCKSYDFVHFLSGENVGFGAGHNRVLDYLESDYHLIVNPDVKFDPMSIRVILDYMEKNPNVGVCSPKAVYPGGNDQIMARLIPAPFDLLLRRSRFFAWIFNKRFRLHSLPYYCKAPVECYFLHGFFLVFQTSLFKSLQGYDNNYFMYMEDVDILRRASKQSKVIYLPNVTIQHEFNRSSKKNTKLFLFHLKSAFYYFNKWGWFFDPERKKLNKRVLSQAC